MESKFTVRNEIIKWLINEKIIRDVNAVKRWSDEKIKNFYTKIVNEMKTFNGVLN